MTVEILLTPWEAHRGGCVRILVPARLGCPICRGHGNVGFFECWRCAGEGAIEAEYPVSITFSPGISDNHVVRVPLDRLGVHNFYLTVLFKVSAMF